MISDEKSNINSTVILVPSDAKVDANIKKPNFPCIVINEDFFYTTEGFEPATINRWKRRNGWYKPVNSTR
jgi:hypothetical protein